METQKIVNLLPGCTDKFYTLIMNLQSLQQKNGMLFMIKML